MGHSFQSEWITIGDDTRVFLESRYAFISSTTRFIARVVVEILRAQAPNARLMKIFHDNKNSQHHIFLASDNPDDKTIATTVEKIINNIYGYQNDIAEITIVKPGNYDLDGYNHTFYLLENSGLFDWPLR